MRPLLVLTLAAAHAALSTARNNVLIIGDSMGEYAGSTLGNVCGGATSFNQAIGGTTAQQWANAVTCTSPANRAQLDPEEACCRTEGQGVQGCSVPGVKTIVPNVDRIWLTVGGNEGLSTACQATQSFIQTQVSAAISATQAAYPGVPIIMTGYAPPTQVVEDTCTLPKFVEINSAVADAAAAASNVTFVNIASDFCGSPTKHSSSTYYLANDPVHFNLVGYQRLWNLPAVRTALGCTGTATLPDTLCSGSAKITGVLATAIMAVIATCGVSALLDW